MIGGRRVGVRADYEARPAIADGAHRLLLAGRLAMHVKQDDVGAGVDEIVIDRFRDAEAASRVLAIDGDEIELPVADQRRQALQHDRAPAAPDDVTDEQDTHYFTF